MFNFVYILSGMAITFAQSREFFKCCFNADMNRVFIVLTYVAKCMQQGTLEILLILDHLTLYLDL